MSTSSPGGVGARFAHLARVALGASRPKAEEDDEKKKPDPDAEGDDEEGDDEGKKKPDPDAEGDDEGDDEGKKKPDPDDEDDDKEASAYARGRRAERARCGAIFAAPEAALNPALAAHLAFDTGQSASQAVGTLKAAGAGAPPARTGLSERMRGEGGKSLGPDRSAGPVRGTPDGDAAFILGAAGLAPTRGK